MSKKVILVVDDDIEKRNVVMAMLNKALPRILQGQYEIHVADNVEMAEDFFSGYAIPFLIISDYRMPGKSGLELFGIIKKRFPDVKFILISGLLPEEVAKNRGIAFLKKPFDVNQLSRAIEKLIAS